MPFLASHPVPCIKCGATIAKGEPISWTRGKGATPGVYHVVCPAAIPAAVSFAMPDETTKHRVWEGMVASIPETTPDDDPLPDWEEPVTPRPGTRAWFDSVKIADREIQLVLDAGHCVTIRDFNKLVTRYSRRLSDRETKRFKRYARGVWAGLTARFVDDETDTPDYRQQELIVAPHEPTHGEDTMKWRQWMATQVSA